MCAYVSCTQYYAPKPRGYFRIEPPAPVYTPLEPDSFLYTFNKSVFATVDIPSGDAGWFNLSYPALNATIYCTYLPITPSTFGQVIDEAYRLISDQTKDIRGSVTLRSFIRPEHKVYATLFEMDDLPVSPVQFILTDSASYFFRGSLLYDGAVNADSISPVTAYLKTDIMELIQSFRRKETR
jgi:gliding motility-associated lipoprotein GldD